MPKLNWKWIGDKIEKKDGDFSGRGFNDENISQIIDRIKEIKCCV